MISGEYQAGSFSDLKHKLASSPSQSIQSNEIQIEVNIKVVKTQSYCTDETQTKYKLDDNLSVKIISGLSYVVIIVIMLNVKTCS